jgi:hypothetical protein
MTAAWAKVAVRTAPMTVDDANVMQVMVVSPLRSCVILPQNTANAVPGRGHYCAARRHQQDSALKFSYHNFKMQMSCRPRLLFSPSGLGGRDIPFSRCLFLVYRCGVMRILRGSAVTVVISSWPGAEGIENAQETPCDQRCQAGEPIGQGSGLN